MVESGVSYLIRKHWKRYLWQVSLAAVLVLIVGVVEHVMVMAIPLSEVQLKWLILPALVGGFFGFLLTTVSLMRKEQRCQLGLLRHKEENLLNEINLRKVSDKRNKRLSYAIQGSDDGLWDWNIQTDEIYFSPRWEEILGYEPDELDTHVDSWRNAIHPEDSSKAFACMDQHL